MTKKPESKLDSIVLGIEIIRRYEPHADVAADHDIFFVGDYETTYSKMTDEEKESMDEQGWFKQYDSWAIFV